MINRKDDCASFLILSCHKYPAYRSVAEGQIRASPGRENVPCCPPFLHLTSYRPVASTSQCNTSSGICFSAHLIKIGVLFSLESLVYVLPSGQEKPKRGPFTQL